MWMPGKKSIFNPDDDYDEADLEAPDFDADTIEECDEALEK